MKNETLLPSEIMNNLYETIEKLYKATVEFIRNHQKEKGYIDTQDDSNDCIYAMHYNDKDGAFYEHRVRAVRYNEELELLQIVCDDVSFQNDYQPNDFELSEEDISHAEWFDVSTWGEFLYLELLWSIADNIEEYTYENND